MAVNSPPKASTDPPPATFTFEFTGPKPKIPTNMVWKPLPDLSFSMASPQSVREPPSLPPWKIAGYIPPTTASPDFPVNVLTTNLRYIIKIRDRSLLDHNWAVAHQCILKMIRCLKRNVKNTEFITNSIQLQSVSNVTTFSSMLNHLHFDLFHSHVRLRQYDEAWEIYERLDFKHMSHPNLGHTVYKELISTTGFLDRAFKIPIPGPSILGTETDTRKRLLNQAEICCRKAIDAAIGGTVVVYGRPVQYELYAIIAVIKLEQGNLEDAVFWKSLVSADELEIEKDLVSSPFLTRWIENYEQIRDPVLQNIIERTEGDSNNSKPKLGEIVEQKLEGLKVKKLDRLKELREELAAGLNEIKGILKQGLQDIKDEHQSVEELKEELQELKFELEEDIDRVRDEMDDLRDEFGDKLLEELQEGLDPKLTLDLRLESVSIANKRVAEMNRELEKQLNDLKAELLPSGAVNDSLSS